jgi:hypothetical protein
LQQAWKGEQSDRLMDRVEQGYQSIPKPNDDLKCSCYTCAFEEAPFLIALLSRLFASKFNFRPFFSLTWVSKWIGKLWRLVFGRILLRSNGLEKKEHEAQAQSGR